MTQSLNDIAVNFISKHSAPEHTAHDDEFTLAVTIIEQLLEQRSQALDWLKIREAIAADKSKQAEKDGTSTIDAALWLGNANAYGQVTKRIEGESFEKIKPDKPIMH